VPFTKYLTVAISDYKVFAFTLCLWMWCCMFIKYVKKYLTHRSLYIVTKKFVSCQVISGALIITTKTTLRLLLPGCVTLNEKGKGQYICIAPYCRRPTSKAFGYGNALSRDLTVLPAHRRVYPQMEWTIPAFAFPAEAGLIYRPRRDGRLSWPGQAERWVNSRSRTAIRDVYRGC